MTKADPTIRIPVDPTNPGQFFACCGLLELADRLWSGAEGWFSGTFCLQPVEAGMRAAASPARLLDELARCRVTNMMTDAQSRRLDEFAKMTSKQRAATHDLQAEKKTLDSLRRESPIRLHAPFNLLIDWFVDDRTGGTRYKTWAGQQSVITITEGMHRPLSYENWAETPPDEWLSRSIPAGDLPFNFDSRLSGQGSAIDAGFSFDPLGFKMRSRPLLELSAFIGLQRFRPTPVPNDNLYRFDLWPVPLLPSAAAAAACGEAAVPGARRHGCDRAGAKFFGENRRSSAKNATQ